jgi:N-acylneuraminate cytidylyltransferase
MGIGMLGQAGIPVVVVSKERNAVVAARCRKLDVPFHQAVDDKPSLLDRLIAEMSLRAEACVFVGNDVNDIQCMRRVGCGVAPADAHPDALQAADIVLQAGGGHGAVREICDRILAERSLRHD